MRNSSNHASTFVHWRRPVIVEDVTERRDPCVALDRAQIPHVIGLHYRYKMPTGKPREGEQWVIQVRLGILPHRGVGPRCLPGCSGFLRSVKGARS
jgi:hypothetical protein